MKNRWRLPLTLRGAGGIRLINMPGVIYPASVLHGTPEAGTCSSNPLRAAPAGFISSQQAAEMLGISSRSARAMLSRRKTRRLLVREPGGALRAYWDIKAVLDVREHRAPLVADVPEKMCSSIEACCILMVARSSLYRYVKQGILREFRVRRHAHGGVRVESYFLRNEVRKLAAQRNAMRLRVAESRRTRLLRQWQQFRDGHAASQV